MKLIPLKDVNDEIEFWKGTRFRIYGIGLNVENKNDDFYEYMLAEIPVERAFMLLTCVEGYKSGSTIALVKTSQNKSKFIVKCKEVKFSIGIENVYLIDEK